MATQAPSLQPQEQDTYKIVSVIRWILAQITGTVAPVSSGTSAPGGRLTLSTGVPVLVATVSGATTVYFTPYIHQSVPLYDGSNMTLTDIGGELSQTTSDTTKSPAAVAASKNYDVFVWTDSGTFRATRGPSWTSSTVRGTGAGTTELVRTKGVWLNANSITNGPAASRGTYVGTISSNGSSQIDFIVPSTPAAGGTAGFIGIWNAYNQERFTALSMDSNDSYSYTTAAWRQADASAGMQTSFVVGLSGGKTVSALNEVWSSGSGNGRAGIGFNSTITLAGTSTALVGFGSSVPGVAFFTVVPPIGLNYLAAIEFGTTGLTIYGDAGQPGQLQSGMEVTGWY